MPNPGKRKCKSAVAVATYPVLTDDSLPHTFNVVEETHRSEDRNSEQANPLVDETHRSEDRNSEQADPLDLPQATVDETHRSEDGHSEQANPLVDETHRSEVSNSEQADPLDFPQATVDETRRSEDRNLEQADPLDPIQEQQTTVDEYKALVVAKSGKLRNSRKIRRQLQNQRAQNAENEAAAELITAQENLEREIRILRNMKTLHDLATNSNASRDPCQPFPSQCSNPISASIGPHSEHLPAHGNVRLYHRNTYPAQPIPSRSTTFVQQNNIPDLTTKIPKNLPQYNKGESMHEFLGCFQRVVRANGLSVEEHWHRLILIALDNGLADWVEQELSPNLPWQEAKDALVEKLFQPGQQQALLRSLATARLTHPEDVTEYCGWYSRLFRESKAPDGPAACEQFLFTLPFKMQQAMHRHRMVRSKDGITPEPFETMERCMQVLIANESWNM